jgi:starch phosphorylase
VAITNVADGPGRVIPVDQVMHLRADVKLGRLHPSDVVVELYVGRIDLSGDLAEGTTVVMQTDGEASNGVYRYTVDTAIGRSGLHGFTVRARPCHPDMPARFVPGLVCWAADSAEARPAPAAAGRAGAAAV